MVGRGVEGAAKSAASRNDWMQRRIRYFGKACLTTQEYRAVVYSLYGLPQLERDRNTGLVIGEIEKPTLTFVALKMRITQGRVSQLLIKAADALTWFDEHGYGDVGWHWKGHQWEFTAPVGEAPAQTAQVRIVKDRSKHAYRLAFAGEL